MIELTPLRHMTAADLGWAMKGPCDDCPFRRDAPDHEGIIVGLPGVIESIQSGNFAHTCHKTDNRADGHEILPCTVCGEPAASYDRFWPCYSDHNFCAEHGGNDLAKTAAELRAIEVPAAKKG